MLPSLACPVVQVGRATATIEAGTDECMVGMVTTAEMRVEEAARRSSVGLPLGVSLGAPSRGARHRRGRDRRALGRELPHGSHADQCTLMRSRATDSRRQTVGCLADSEGIGPRARWAIAILRHGWCRAVDPAAVMLKQ